MLEIAHGVGVAASVGLADWHMLAYLVGSLMQCHLPKEEAHRLIYTILSSFKSMKAIRDSTEAAHAGLSAPLDAINSRLLNPADRPESMAAELAELIERVVDSVDKLVSGTARQLELCSRAPPLAEVLATWESASIEGALAFIRGELGAADLDSKQVGFYAVLNARYAIGAGPSRLGVDAKDAIPNSLYASLKSNKAAQVDITISGISDMAVRLSILPMSGLAIVNSSHGRCRLGNVPLFRKTLSRSTALDTSVLDLFWGARPALAHINFVAAYLANPLSRRIMLGGTAVGETPGVGQFDLFREVQHRYERVLELHSKGLLMQTERTWGCEVQPAGSRDSEGKKTVSGAASAGMIRSLADMLPIGVPLNKVPREVLCPREQDYRWTTTATHTREASGAYRDWLNVLVICCWAAAENRSMLVRLEEADIMAKAFDLMDPTSVAMYQFVDAITRGWVLACVLAEQPPARGRKVVSETVALVAWSRQAEFNYLASSPAKGIFDSEAPFVGSVEEYVRRARGTAEGAAAVASLNHHVA